MIFLAEILLIAAAIFKAVADTVDHHFDTSIFRRLEPKFWDRDISSNYAKRIFNYKVDAWHLSQSAMIVCMIAAIALHHQKLAWYFEIVIGGIIWNIVFNTFYNKILR